MLGTPVTFGSEVQLYHVHSKCFVRTTREKNLRKNDLYNLRLSKRGGSGMYFKIIPHLAFKREGERVSLKDLFFLENTKLQAAIVYKNIPEYPPLESFERDGEQMTLLPEIGSKPSNQENRMSEYQVSCMPILEMTTTFSKYEAGLQQQQELNCPLGVKLLQMRSLIPGGVGMSKAILWGDYVRLKFMVDTKTTGYFYSDDSIIGDSPYVYCRTVRATLPFEKESFQGIFQLVPETEDMYGRPIRHGGTKSIVLRLKHLLTGRYLMIGSPDEKCLLSETLDEYLSLNRAQTDVSQLENFDFTNINLTANTGNATKNPLQAHVKKLAGFFPLSRPPVAHSKSGPIKQLDASPSMSNFNNLLDRMKSKPPELIKKQASVDKSRHEPSGSLNMIPAIQNFNPLTEILTEKDGQSLHHFPENAQDLAVKEEEPPIGPLRKFLERTKIILHNASQDDEDYLTAGSVFSLESPFQGAGYLSVKLFSKGDKNEENAFEWMDKPNSKHQEDLKGLFHAKFHDKNKNPLEKEEFEAVYSGQNDKYFHFTTVALEEISEILAIQSRVFPLVKVIQDTQDFVEEDLLTNSRLVDKNRKRDSLLNKKNIENKAKQRQTNLDQALEAVRKLNTWLDGGDISLDTGFLHKKAKQKMCRELGVIDLVFQILIQFFTKNLLNAESKDLTYYKPLTQAIFSLLKSIIQQNKVNNIYVFQWSELQQEMTLSQTIANDLGVDKLLSQIFYESVIEISEFSRIPDHLDFKNFDLKALNIAIALYQYNPTRSIKERDEIISLLVMNERNQHKIFRKFVRDQLGDIIVLNYDRDKSLRIDTSLEYREKKIFDYTLGIVNLATEITRSKPQVVWKSLSKYFPQQLCTDIFKEKKWSNLFRSSFLDLFIEMYFEVASIHLPKISFPSNVKFSTNVNVPAAITDLFEKRKNNVLKQFTEESFMIKEFIEGFLKDAHKWADDEHKYVQSVFKLIGLMCEKGLYDLDELRRLKEYLYNYLKVGLAVVHDDISPEARLFLRRGITKQMSRRKSDKRKQRDSSNGQKKKNNQEKDKKKEKAKSKAKEKVKEDETAKKSGKEDEKDNEKDEVRSPTRILNREPIIYEQLPDGDEDATNKVEPYWRKTEIDEMILWMQEVLHILIFIENYELDNRQKEFFENDKSLRFFNEKLMYKTDLNEGFNSVVYPRIKKDKIDYVLKYMNDSFESQNYKHTLLLIEMLLINNLTLTKPLVQLLYLNFSNYKQFLTGINTTHIIYSSNLNLYEKYSKIYDSLRYYKIELESVHDLQNSAKSTDIYVATDIALEDLKDDLYESMSKYVDTVIPVVPFTQIYDDCYFDSSIGKGKQKLLLNLGFFEILTELFVPLVEGSWLISDSKRRKFIENFLYIYIYFCFKNPENQEVFTSNKKLLECLFKIKYQSLQPLLLRLISELYRDNYSLLVQVSQSRSNVIELMLDKFFTNFTTHTAIQDEFFIHCLRIFSTFFQIRNNFLTYNQTFFADSFHFKVIERKDVCNINNILFNNLSKFLSLHKLEDFKLSGNSNVIKIPLEVSFAIYFLNAFAMMTAASSSSNSSACLKNKYYLSIKQISTLIRNSGDWFNLKLALVTYLNHVYIKNKKSEDNEVSELQKIIRECMFEEISEYNRFLKNRHLYPRPEGQRFAESFTKHYPIPTEFKYSDIVDEVYHQYIIFGVMDSFTFYAQRIKDEATENDHAIVDDYVSSSLKELHDLWKSGIFQKKNTGLDMSAIFLKHKMIAPLDEPTDPDINEGDLYNPHKNERKKVSQLKKDMSVLTNAIRNVELAVELKIFDISNYGSSNTKSTYEYMFIDQQTIERKHNNELEVLVKFLLELKVENPWKFKMIIKSFMSVLISEETEADIKQSALIILRKLSNFKEDPELYEAIQLDFIQLNFIDFFDDIIINAKTEDDRLEFIMGMIDFLDDASLKIQQELFENLTKDEDNKLLETIAKFMLTSFEEFRENERNFNEQSEDIQKNAKLVVYKKMYSVINALELLRLACENHYESMQNYLREQVQDGVKNKRSINFIDLIADIFNRYTKSINERNANLGIKILDTLIEMLQGPCQENQIALCNTKVLESLEDLTVEVKNIRSKREGLIWIEMNKKIIILIQAILEGSYNSYIVQQVSIHVNVNFFLERMYEAYNKASLERSKVTSQKKGNDDNLNYLMTIDLLEGQLEGPDRSDISDVGYNALLKEGIELAIILNFLSDTSADIKQKVEAFKEKLGYDEIDKYKGFQKADLFYSRNIGQIEIVNRKDDLQRIYFPIIKKTKYLSGVTKGKFLDEVKRESANEKLFGLLRYQDLFLDEMEHFLSLRQKGLRFSLTHFSRLRNVNLLLAFITNLIILFSFDKVTYNLKGGTDLDNVIKGFGIVHIILSALVLVFWGIFKAPLDLRAAGKILKVDKQGERISQESDLNSGEISGMYKKMNYWYSRANYMVFHTYMVYLILALVCSFLGTFYSIIFFAFLLLDLIDRSVILNNVVKSVTLNYKQLLMTFALGVLLMYIYAVIGFFAVIDPETSLSDYQTYCSNPWHCFLSVANNGLRAGGGVGDVLNQIDYHGDGFTKRYFYDLIYYLMIIVILLNIVFGIIIDTFAELRDQKRLKGNHFIKDSFIYLLTRL